MSAEVVTQKTLVQGEGDVPLDDPVAHQFNDASQQHNAAVLGMWSFLATEVLFFGGLFLVYIIYRFKYRVPFTLASHHLDVWMGGLNTGVLLVSSLLVAFAVRDARLGRTRNVLPCLIGTILLAITFLGIKAVEWRTDWHENLVPFFGNFQLPTGDLDRMLEAGISNEPSELGMFRMFFVLYFFVTGLHAIHITIAIGIWTVVTILVWKKRHVGGYANMVEIVGLFWHFVDIIWVFVYPLFYLIDPHLKSH